MVFSPPKESHSQHLCKRSGLLFLHHPNVKARLKVQTAQIGRVDDPANRLQFGCNLGFEVCSLLANCLQTPQTGLCCFPHKCPIHQLATRLQAFSGRLQPLCNLPVFAFFHPHLQLGRRLIPHLEPCRVW